MGWHTECICDEFKPNIEKLSKLTEFALTRGMNPSIKQYSHCPYCGRKLRKIDENGKEDLREASKLSKEVLETMYLDMEFTKGEKIIVEPNALDVLWDSGILYDVCVKLIDGNGAMALAVNANDVFLWACADFELFTSDEIQGLYEACFDEEGYEKPWGSVKWVCKHRKMRPQHPMEDAMKKDGYWDEELEALPVRGDTG
jgi:predicted metal-binding transcription factor (methanogenesis marker protein 9)